MRRRRRLRKRKQDSGAPKWMVTYSDMVTLVLVFFILLFSMSRIDLVKFQAISESFRDRAIFDFFPSPVPMDHPSDNPEFKEGDEEPGEFNYPPRPDDEDEEEKRDALSELMEEVEEFLDEEDLHNVVTANRTERGVVLVLQERILFDSGEATILSSGEPFLQKIGKLFTNIPNHIKVEGHTDSVPMHSYRYPSNWELSGARASSVIRYLLDEFPLDEKRFSLAGYGETRPVKPNTSSENRQANRRVEIVILNEGEDPDQDN
ncbi:MAG TPA: flagellar motor protein MotS [Bacillota bacterium]|nr:flagellar motor protein MotS [Bacillota bacterium]